jgi:hypothetical protein
MSIADGCAAEFQPHDFSFANEALASSTSQTRQALDIEADLPQRS